MEVRAVIIHVQGKVQGVFFRESARRTAVELGVNGTARNLSDGRVRLEAEAQQQAVDEFIKWCHTGPPKANVEQVQVERSEVQNFTEFQILR